MARDIRLDQDYEDFADVYVWITDDIPGLVALGCNGGAFAHHASSKLLSMRGCWSSVRYWMLISAFSRGDQRGVLRFLDDWVKQDRLPKAQVSKFVPGEHYHVLGVKFDTLDEAQRHLRSRGYQYGGLTEKYVYREE